MRIDDSVWETPHEASKETAPVESILLYAPNCWNYRKDKNDDIYKPLYDQAKQLPNVNYKGYISNEDLMKQMYNYHIFAYPNIWEETFCVSMAEAMRCGAYPIITNIGALSEVAGENFASVVSLNGTRTTRGYKVTEDFLNTFAEFCCTALDYFEENKIYYNQISRSLSNHILQKCDWKKIAHQWKKLITKIKSCS